MADRRKDWRPRALVRVARTGLARTLAGGCAVGLVCAALLSAPRARDLEEDAGLPWLFALRGPLAPPEQVAVVMMSRRAAANISLPREPESFQRCLDIVIGRAPPTHVQVPPLPSRWPRCLHARLVERLAAAGARTIVFDALFRGRPPETGDDLQTWQDKDLGAALKSAGRVVLARKLEVVGGSEVPSQISPAIEAGALGSAPFPIVPTGRRRFDRFLTFTDASRGAPTLPAVALQAYLLDGYAPLSKRLARYGGELGQLLPETSDDIRASGELQATGALIRQLFRNDPTLGPRVLADLEQAGARLARQGPETSAKTLLALYAGEGSRLLNFYGPPGTLSVIGYDAALAAPPERMTSLFKGRAVFIGYAETDEAEQVEHFATPMSSGRGPDLSGVEIAATAFSNLLRGDSIRALPFGYSLAIIFLSGLLANVVCARLRNKIALAVLVAGLSAYGASALYLFSAHQVWLPVVRPMLAAAPAAALSSFAWKYWTARRQREQLRRAFGYFVPPEVVSRLESNAEEVRSTGESVECACVATDAANYTPLAEAMSPEKLAEFLNRYFEALFGGVANQGGFVSDVVGDAMLALWPRRTAGTRRHALTALIEMRDAAERFSENLAGEQLITRFGADWGRVRLTTVGAGAHYEYRAVGDPVNTATRIQELNKRLNTRVLVSQPALGDLGNEFLVRDVGSFLLRGKSNPVRVFEVLGRRVDATREQTELCALFAEALEALTDGRNERAADAFRSIQAAFPADGPTGFYLRVLAAGGTLQQGAVIRPD